MVLPDVSQLLENLDVNQIAESIGIDVSRAGALSVLKPYSYRLTSWSLTPELRDHVKDFKMFILQGRGGFGLTGLPTYIWATRDFIMDVSLENGDNWWKVKLSPFVCWDKNFVRSRIRSLSFFLDRSTGKVVKDGKIRDIMFLYETHRSEGKLSETEMQEVWGNFRNLRNPFDPTYSRYPERRGGLLGAIL